MRSEPMAKRAGSDGPSRVNSVDLLSALPDGVLHTILLFLPARHAVQTSVLSWRWRDIWCSMPCINIDEREFEVGASGQIKERWDRFEDFTTNLLLFHRNYVSLDKFRIYAHCHNEQHVHVDRWVRLGIRYNPLVLEIEIPWDIGDNIPFKLPKLGSSLCRLSRLSLSNVILDSHFAELLGSGCPALVDFELTSCFSIPQDITLTTVKKFVMNACYNIGDARRPMFIRAPKLVSLELVTVDLGGISVCNAANLVKASVHNISFSAKKQCILLGGLSNVMSLELVNFDTLGMLDKSSNNFPMFPNMCTLSLKRCFLDEKYGLDSKLADLGSFLENAPCLEKLTLSCCMFSIGSGLDSDIERKSISLQSQDGKTFQCPKLKLIEVV